jgi:hypothetical protein
MLNLKKPLEFSRQKIIFAVGDARIQPPAPGGASNIRFVKKLKFGMLKMLICLPV